MTEAHTALAECLSSGFQRGHKKAHDVDARTVIKQLRGSDKTNEASGKQAESKVLKEPLSKEVAFAE